MIQSASPADVRAADLGKTWEQHMRRGEFHRAWEVADAVLRSRGGHTFAAVMRSLDLVISIDSMPAHLAGALGTRGWTLLPSLCDWRWMDARDDSPWYPTMRLFRQPHTGEWEPVVAEVSRDLNALMRTRALRRASRTGTDCSSSTE